MEEKINLIKQKSEDDNEFQPASFSDSFSLNKIQKNLQSNQPKRVIKLTKVIRNFTIANLVFDIILILNLFKPKFFQNFKHNCHLQLEFADFLDLLINCSLMALMNYFSFAYKNVYQTNIKIVVVFSMGFISLWLAIKYSFYNIHQKNHNCLYLGLYEYLLNFFFPDKFLIMFIIETLLIFTIITLFIRQYNLKHFLRMQHLNQYEQNSQINNQLYKTNCDKINVLYQYLFLVQSQHQKILKYQSIDF